MSDQVILILRAPLEQLLRQPRTDDRFVQCALCNESGALLLRLTTLIATCSCQRLVPMPMIQHNDAVHVQQNSADVVVRSKFPNRNYKFTF